VETLTNHFQNGLIYNFTNKQRTKKLVSDMRRKLNVDTF
jgi:hypothetical protein